MGVCKVGLISPICTQMETCSEPEMGNEAALNSETRIRVKSSVSSTSCFQAVTKLVIGVELSGVGGSTSAVERGTRCNGFCSNDRRQQKRR